MSSHATRNFRGTLTSSTAIEGLVPDAVFPKSIKVENVLGKRIALSNIAKICTRPSFVGAEVQVPVTSPEIPSRSQVRVSVLLIPSQANKRSDDVGSEAITGLLALVKYSN